MRYKEEARRSYHDYSAGTAFSAARSITVTDAATVTAATTVYADDVSQPASTISGNY